MSERTSLGLQIEQALREAIAHRAASTRLERDPVASDWHFNKGMTGEGFDGHVREQLPWYDLATTAVATIARNYLPTNGVLYDIGASTGNITRAVAPIATERKAHLISVESSEDMAATWQGEGLLIVSDAVDMYYEPFDVAVLFLTLMFIPVERRKILIGTLRRTMRAGGCIIIVDKAMPPSGYIGTVMRRLTLDWKLRNGAQPEAILNKELSLSGVQRPISTSEIPDAVEFFRMGEFAGWIIEHESA